MSDPTPIVPPVPPLPEGAVGAYVGIDGRVEMPTTHGLVSERVAVVKMDDYLALAAKAARADELDALLGEAIGELKRVGSHRALCHDYDEDVGLPKRDFSDDEEWDRVEGYAREVVARIDAQRKGRT